MVGVVSSSLTWTTNGGLRLKVKSAGCEPANARFESGSLPQRSVFQTVEKTASKAVQSEFESRGSDQILDRVCKTCYTP